MSTASYRFSLHGADSLTFAVLAEISNEGIVKAFVGARCPSGFSLSTECQSGLDENVVGDVGNAAIESG